MLCWLAMASPLVTRLISFTSSIMLYFAIVPLWKFEKPATEHQLQGPGWHWRALHQLFNFRRSSSPAGGLPATGTGELDGRGHGALHFDWFRLIQRRKSVGRHEMHSDWVRVINIQTENISFAWRFLYTTYDKLKVTIFYLVLLL